MLAHPRIRLVLLTFAALRAAACAGPDLGPSSLPALEAGAGKADQASAAGARYLLTRDASGRVVKARIAPAAPPPAGVHVAADSAVAVDFLTRSGRALDLDDALLGALRPAALDELGDTVAVDLEQAWDGLPVLEAGVRVVYHRSGEVETVHLAPVRGIVAPAARHALTPAEAADTAVAAAGGGPAADPPDVQSGWFVNKEQLRPAFAVELTVGAPPDSWRYVIDAATGAVLASRPLRTDLTGKGRVWRHNAWVDHQTELADLPRLTSATALVGRYARAVAADGTAAAGTNGLFDYPAADRRFTQVMAYAHVDELAAYADSLGFETRLRPIPAHVDSMTELNAYYDGRTLQLYFGFDAHFRAADDADAIHHELGHAIVDGQAPWLMRARTPYEPALHEGYADYLACSFADDPYVAEALMQALYQEYGDIDALSQTGNDPRHPGRRCDNSRRWPDDAADDPHVTGMIVSGALWDLRAALVATHAGDTGPKLADRLALTALRYLGKSGNEPRDVLEALLVANRRLKAGATDAITAAFERHGVTAAP
jgi:hypothetical protein